MEPNSKLKATPPLKLFMLICHTSIDVESKIIVVIPILSNVTKSFYV